MKWLSLLLALCVSTAQAQSIPFPGPGGSASSGATYQGPGDVVSGATVWGSCARAYNAAYANGTNSLCDLKDKTTGTVAICTLRVLTTGFVDLAGSYCIGSTTPALACAAAAGGACVVSKVYDQTGNGNHFTEATVGNMPGLTFSALNGLPGLTFTSAAASQVNTGNLTIPIPFSISSVIKRTTGTVQAAPIGAQAAGSATCGPYSTTAQFWVGNVTAITGIWTENAFHAVQCRENNDGGVIAAIDGTTASGSNGTAAFSATPGRMGRNTVGGSLDGIIMEAGIWGVAFNSTQYGGMNTNQHSSTNGYNF